MIVVETFLICDGGCGETFGVDNRERSANQQRASAKENEWKHIKGKDLCPKCKQKYIINGKEVKAPGKFYLFNDIICTPQERLIKLQELYNSMEYEQDTDLNRMKCNCYMDEISEIVRLHPELGNMIRLKDYGI